MKFIIIFCTLIFTLGGARCSKQSGNNLTSKSKIFFGGDKIRKNKISCPRGSRFSNNKVPFEKNGCGPTSSRMIAVLLKLILPDEFQECCNKHDYCYQKCYGSDDTAKVAICDKPFLECMKGTCYQKYPEGNGGINFGKRQWCKGRAEAAYLAVEQKGDDAYESSQREHCNCHRG